MGNDFIPVNEPLLDGNEKKYLCECIDTGWISSEGPFVTDFERKFAARVGRAGGVAVCNGTAALDMAIEVLGLGQGDEIIVPTFTIVSCLLQLVRAGATPVLVDCDPATFCMDVSAVAAKITPRTRAIMVVHIYGLPVDMDPILALAQKHGLKIIEDAAEAHGQDYKGRPCGSLGDVSIFSFYPNKLVTTGEGGMLLANDESILAQCRDLRNLCHKEGQRFVHERLGWNMRMTNMQAALGLAQLERIDEFAQRKRRMGQRYTELLGGIEGLQLPRARTDYADNIYWVYGVVLDDALNMDARQAMRLLAQEGVGCRPFFYPMHLQPIFHDLGLFKGEHYPVAERICRQGFYLPSGLALTDAQMERVAAAARKVLQR